MQHTLGPTYIEAVIKERAAVTYVHMFTAQIMTLSVYTFVNGSNVL